MDVKRLDWSSTTSDATADDESAAMMMMPANKNVWSASVHAGRRPDAISKNFQYRRVSHLTNHCNLSFLIKV